MCVLTPPLGESCIIFGAAPDRVRDLTRRVVLHYTRGKGVGGNEKINKYTILSFLGRTGLRLAVLRHRRATRFSRAIIIIIIIKPYRRSVCYFAIVRSVLVLQSRRVVGSEERARVRI